MTSAIQNNSSTSTATSAAAAASTNLTKNFSSFLTLLTTQLQNQDPLSPMDSNEFTSQLVQFSQVEQSINSNKTLESMLSVLQSSMTTSAASYIGKQVVVSTATAGFDGSNPVTWQYTNDGTAVATKLAVVDAKGNVVKTLTGSTASGTQSFTWDGKDTNGDTVASGDYTLKAVSVDKTGAAVTNTIGTISTVTGVDTTGSTITLVTKNGDIALSDVTQIMAGS